MPVGNTSATRSPRSIPSAARPPATASARSRISPHPTQSACSRRSRKRTPPPLMAPDAPMYATSVSAKLSPHHLDQVADGLDGGLVGLVEDDAKAVLDFHRQGEQAHRVELEAFDQPHLPNQRALPAEVPAHHLRDAGEHGVRRRCHCKASLIARLAPPPRPGCAARAP